MIGLEQLVDLFCRLRRIRLVLLLTKMEIRPVALNVCGITVQHRIILQNNNSTQTQNFWNIIDIRFKEINFVYMCIENNYIE